MSTSSAQLRDVTRLMDGSEARLTTKVSRKGGHIFSLCHSAEEMLIQMSLLLLRLLLHSWTIALEQTAEISGSFIAFHSLHR